MKRFKLALSLFFAAIVIIFVFQNAASVDIGFLFWSFTISRSLLIFGVMIIGVIIGWLLRESITVRRKMSG